MLRLAAHAFAHATRLRRSLRSGVVVEGITVISVGGLRVGGVGKSPVARALCAFFQREGASCVIVMRGYGGRTTGPHRVSLDDTADSVGDEAVEHLHAGCDVIVARDRVAGVNTARAHGFSIAVLDDGFQHLALARDLDVVMLCAEDLSARVLPAGPLREPLDALADAHAIVTFDPSLTRVEGREVLLATRSLVSLHDADGTLRPLEDFRGARATLVTAIARPERVRAALVAAGITISTHRALRDHRPLDARDVARAAGDDLVIITAKDEARTLNTLAPDPRRFATRERVALPEALCQQARRCASPKLRDPLKSWSR